MRNRPDENCRMRAVVTPAKHRGLTLVELLVAISVLGLVATLGWRGLDSIVRSRIALVGDLEQTRGMQLAFAQLQSDCAHLASPSALPNRVPLAVEEGRLMLVRTVFSDNQPSRLQVITYQVRGGVLTRRESALTRDLRELDSLWLAAANDTATAQAVTLQTGVAALTMRLWDGNGWRTDAGSLAPTGLEVALRLQGRDASLLKVFMLGAV